MNRIRLTPGTYRADTDCELSLFQGEQEQEEYPTIAAGETFDIPETVNHFAYFLTYHPDFGDAEPRATKL